MRFLAFIAGTAVVVSIAFAGASAGSPAAGRCDLWAAPTGADTNRGTKASPFLTLGKLASSLRPGQTGCLPPGASFAEREVITAVGAARARVTITTAPGGPRAVLADGIETTQATRFLTLTNLAIGARDDSALRSVSGTVILRGYSTALTRSDVGPGTLTEAGRSCVWLDHAGSALIEGNVLHECNGASPGRYGAGVLASISTGARIRNNVIYGNAGGDAIAFSPNAHVSVARLNLLVDNLGGIYFGGDLTTASRDNLVENNVIARNSRYDVHSAYGSGGRPVGSGNVVRKNCIWSPGAVTAAGIGFEMHANRKVRPRVVQATGTRRLAVSSPCRSYRPRP
jgi:Right handed beta helix region